MKYVNFLTGNVDIRNIPKTRLQPDEKEKFDLHFNLLVNKIRRKLPYLADIYEEFRREVEVAAEIAKGHWDLNYGGFEPTTGTYTMTFIAPRPFIGANDWTKSITSAGWNDFWGSSGSPITGNNTPGTRRMWIIFGTLYLKPAIREVAYHLNINGKDYPPTWIEEEIKIPQLGKSYVVVVLYEAALLIHPTGKFYERKLFRETGDVYAKPIGFMFGEYDYISAESTWYA